jgi:hypothetical protein
VSLVVRPRMKRLYTLALMFIVWASLLMTHAAETVYFPKGAEHWYPKHLEAMKEPSLFQQTTNKQVEQYRFLWLRTFHKPIAVRVRKDNFGITLRVIRLSGAGGYDPGKIEHEKSFALTTDQWNRFLKLLNESSFWDMPSAEKVLDGFYGFDGSQWILEGQAAGRYHVVDRWTPSSGGENRHLESFVACCRYLLRLSKQEIPKRDDY